MPLYDVASRPASDLCYLKYLNDANRRQAEYQVPTDQSPMCSDKTGTAAAQVFAADHPNLRIRSSYGLDACTIDTDSSLKKDAGRMTKDRCRQQLSNRVFQAVPLLAKGSVLPGLESRIQVGTDTSTIQECDNLREKGWNVFHPSLCSSEWQNADHIVQPWTWGGESSRDISRSTTFLSKLGYVQQNRGAWVRP